MPGLWKYAAVVLFYAALLEAVGLLPALRDLPGEILLAVGAFVLLAAFGMGPFMLFVLGVLAFVPLMILNGVERLWAWGFRGWRR